MPHDPFGYHRSGGRVIPHRTYFNLGISQLTRLALTSQDSRIVAAAVEEMRSRSNWAPEILEFATAHLLALTTRDKAMEMLRHYHEVVPKLEQRIRDLEEEQVE